MLIFNAEVMRMYAWATNRPLYRRYIKVPQSPPNINIDRWDDPHGPLEIYVLDYPHPGTRQGAIYINRTVVVGVEERSYPPPSS